MSEIFTPTAYAPHYTVICYTIIFPMILCNLVHVTISFFFPVKPAGLCYGGIARLVTKIRELKESLPNPLLLNGGDSFQGSLLYTLFKWNITVEFMNRIPFDVTVK